MPGRIPAARRHIVLSTLCPFQPEMPRKPEDEPKEHCVTFSKCLQGVFLGHLHSPEEGWCGGGVARQTVKIRVSDILLLERSGVCSGRESSSSPLT